MDKSATSFIPNIPSGLVQQMIDTNFGNGVDQTGMMMDGNLSHQEENMEMISESKVFVGGLSPLVTQDILSEYCSQYGEVYDAVVMIDKYTNRSRGFGFVTFKSPESVTKLMGDRQTEHYIDGKRVQFKRAVPASFAYNPEKIFVGGLPGTCDNEKLKEYFSAYGHVIEAQVMYDKSTNRSRGFGYVNYESADAVEQVLKEFHEHSIDGKWVEVKRCLPNDSRKHQMGEAPGLSLMSPPGKGVSPSMMPAYGWGLPPAFYGGGGKGGQIPYPPFGYPYGYAGSMPYYDPFTAAAAMAAAAPQLAAYGYDWGMYGFGEGLPLLAPPTVAGKGKGKGKGRVGAIPHHQLHQSFEMANGSPKARAVSSLSAAALRGFPSPATLAANPPTMGDGALDVAAIFRSLNQ